MIFVFVFIVCCRALVGICGILETGTLGKIENKPNTFLKIAISLSHRLTLNGTRGTQNHFISTTDLSKEAVFSIFFLTRKCSEFNNAVEKKFTSFRL